MNGMRASAGSGQAAGASAWWFLGTLVREHRMATSDLPVILEMVLPRGAAPPRHLHRRADDSWYMLTGEMVVSCGDGVSLAVAGDWLSMPRGVPHAFRVTGGPARMLAVQADPGFLEMVKDLGEPAPAPELPGSMAGPPLDELSRSMAAHDVIVVGDSMGEQEARAHLARLRR